MARLSKFSTICHTCGIASSDFHRKLYFENHIKSHEAGKAGKAYLCDSCGKGFSTLMDLRIHTQKYHKTELSCIQCAKTIIFVDQLNQHLKSHKLDPYCCDVCSKTFTIFANIQSGKQRFFKIMKYVKNQDKSDMTVFNRKKSCYTNKKSSLDMNIYLFLLFP